MGRFKKLCEEGFVKNMIITAADWLTRGAIRPWVYRYSTDKLESALQDVFAPEHCLFGGIETETRKFGVKLALTATATNGGAFVFGSYNRSEAGKLIFRVPFKPHADVTMK